MNVPLINKYRPASFDEMVGHASIKQALQRALASDSQPHSFLMTGPGGIGKTSSARIIASMLECEVVEISAAENSGTDAMRELIELGNHMSLTGSGRRMIIVDECHGLSKAAWQVLLKILEEPPTWLYLALCTTEHTKVPDTVVQRCYHIALRPLPPKEIEELLSLIIEMEGWQVQDDVFSAVIQASNGSPRKAISILQAVWDAPSREEVSRIINLFDTSEPVIDLCKYLVDGGREWDKLKGLLERIEDDEWDRSHILICRFIAAAMMRAKSAEAAKKLWSMIDALTFPVETYDRKVAFYAALGKIVFS